MKKIYICVIFVALLTIGNCETALKRGIIIQKKFPPLPETTEVKNLQAMEPGLIEKTPGWFVIGTIEVVDDVNALKKQVVAAGGNALMLIKTERTTFRKGGDSWVVKDKYGAWERRYTEGELVVIPESYYFIVVRCEEFLPRELRISKNLDAYFEKRAIERYKLEQEIQKNAKKRDEENRRRLAMSRALDEATEATPERLNAIRALFPETFATYHLSPAVKVDPVIKVFPGSGGAKSQLYHNKNGIKARAEIAGRNGTISEKYDYTGALEYRFAKDRWSNAIFSEAHKDGKLNYIMFQGKRDNRTAVVAYYQNNQCVRVTRINPENVNHVLLEHQYENGVLVKTIVYGKYWYSKPTEILSIKYYAKGKLVKEELFENGRIKETQGY